MSAVLERIKLVSRGHRVYIYWSLKVLCIIPFTVQKHASLGLLFTPVGPVQTSTPSWMKLRPLLVALRIVSNHPTAQKRINR